MKIKYTYQFNNENITIEVDEADYEILITLDKEEYNANRKHSRRYPISLENADYEGDWFADGTDILGELIDKQEKEHIRFALDKLKPAQRDLIRAIYFKGVSVNDYAAQEGVDHSAISHRLKKAYKNLKKLL